MVAFPGKHDSAEPFSAPATSGWQRSGSPPSRSRTPAASPMRRQEFVLWKSSPTKQSLRKVRAQARIGMTASGSGDHHKHGEDHPDPTLRRSLGDHDRTVHATGYPGFTDIGMSVRLIRQRADASSARVAHQLADRCRGSVVGSQSWAGGGQARAMRPSWRCVDRPPALVPVGVDGWSCGRVTSWCAVTSWSWCRVARSARGSVAGRWKSAPDG